VKSLAQFQSDVPYESFARHILDELNGLVMAGEIALERLQRAGEARVTAGGRNFGNHYDLAAHLLNAAGATLRGPEANTAIGRVDLLFELLSRLGLATPNQLKPYLEALHHDTERRPFAEQIIDQLLAEDDARTTRLGIFVQPFAHIVKSANKYVQCCGQL
jgi:hypothetical protein